jgi:hypothetical protein
MMDNLEVGHYVQSKPGAGQPQIHGYIISIERDVAKIDVRRVGQARVSTIAGKLVRTRSLRNLERGEV